MTALIIIGAVLLFLIFLLTRFAGIILKYSDTFSYTVTFGPIRLHPDRWKKKAKKEKKKKKPEQEPSGGEEDEEEKKRREKEEKREKRDALFALVKEVKKLLSGFLGKVHFRSAKLEADVATGDAASTALACGGAKAAASLLFETIDNFAYLEKGSEKHVRIEPDFTSDKSRFDVDVRFRVRLIHALYYGIKVLIKFIKTKIKQERDKS